ncbi:hypothetical protein RCL1_007649 [Eukaryota sp. TZLM3-RCL]
MTVFDHSQPVPSSSDSHSLNQQNPTSPSVNLPNTNLSSSYQHSITGPTIQLHDTGLKEELLMLVQSEDIEVLNRARSSNSRFLSLDQRQSPLFPLYASIYCSDTFPFIDLKDLEQQADVFAQQDPMTVEALVSALYLYRCSRFFGNDSAGLKRRVLEVRCSHMMVDFERYLTQWAECGDLISMDLLGSYFSRKNDETFALYWWEEAKKSNFITSYCGAGTRYSRGYYDLRKDFIKGFAYNQEGVKLGDLGAMNDLSWYLRHGNCPGVAKNPGKAASLLSLAVLHGYVFGLYNLGFMVLDGDFGYTNEDLAHRFFEEGARHNCCSCMKMLIQREHPNKEHWIAEVNRLEVGKPPKPAKKKRVNTQQTSQSCPVQPRVATPLEPVQRPPLQVNNNPQDDVIKALMEQRKRTKANRK